MQIRQPLRSSRQETKVDGLLRVKTMIESIDVLQSRSERSILTMIIVIGVLTFILFLLPSLFSANAAIPNNGDGIDRIIDNQSIIIKLINEISDAKSIFVSQIELLKWVCGGIATSLATTIALLYRHLKRVDTQLHTAHKTMIAQINASAVARDDVWERFIDLANKNQINSLNLANAISSLRDTIAQAPCGQLLRDAMEDAMRNKKNNKDDNS